MRVLPKNATDVLKDELRRNNGNAGKHVVGTTWAKVGMWWQLWGTNEHDLVFLYALLWGAKLRTIYWLDGAAICGCVFSGPSAVLFGACFDYFRSYNAAILLADVALLTAIVFFAMLEAYPYPRRIGIVNRESEGQPEGSVFEVVAG